LSAGHSEALEEPLNSYFENISRHFDARKKLKATHEQLGEETPPLPQKTAPNKLAERGCRAFSLFFFGRASF
jgi:hypothetical protein